MFLKGKGVNCINAIWSMVHFKESCFNNPFLWGTHIYISFSDPDKRGFLKSI